MMQVIDDAYVAALLDLPDGRERVTRWIFDLLNQRDDAQIITKALLEKLKGTVDFLEIEGSAEEAAQLLAWFNQRHDLDLSWDVIDGDLSDCQWRVHQSYGGHNDREWKLICHDETALGALRKAHKAFCDGR